MYLNEDATFEVALENRGPVDATSITLTNTLNSASTGVANLRMEVITSGSVTGVQADGINFTIQSMAPDSSLIIRMTYTLTSPGYHTMSSVARIPAEITNYPELRNQTDVWVEQVERPPLADISIVTTADRTEVPFGENTVVRMTVTNNGPAPAYDIGATFEAVGFHNLTEMISSESTAGTIQEVTSDLPYYSGMVLRLPVLNPGQTDTMTLVFRKKHFSEMTVQTYASSVGTRSLDPNLDNNWHSIILTTTGELPVFDLQTSITASPAAAQPGGLLVYTMSVTNLGPDDVPTTIGLGNRWRKVTFPEWGRWRTLPQVVEDPDVEFISIQNSGQWHLEPWNFEIGDTGLLASLPYLAAGETANLVLVYKVSPEAVGDELGNINNSIAVKADWLTEANTDNNAATASTPITAAGGLEADIMITQSGSAQPVRVNQPTSYSVTAKNLGPNPTSAAYVGYLLPHGASLASVTSDKGTPVVVNKYASVPDVPLAVGEAVTLRVNIVPEQVGHLDSYSAGSSNLFDPNIGNNFTANSILVVESEEPPVVTPEQPCPEPVDLSAQFLKLRSKGKLKKKTGEWQYRVQASVGITNTGTACAPATTVKLYLSDDLTIDSSDLLLATKNIKLKCPGKKAWKAKKVSFKMKLDKGVSPAGRYIIAVTDGDNIVPECNEDNNNAAAF